MKVEALDLQDNYIALALGILLEWTPEQCFDYLETLRRPQRNLSITQEDVADMIKLKENGLTYKEIGELYGLSCSAVYNRIRRQQAKLAKRVG